MDEPESKKCLSCGGAAGEKRAYGEDCEAHVVESDSSMHIGPPTNSDKENCDHETVDRDNPYADDPVGFQVRDDLWKPNHDNARVKGRHENSDCSHRQNDPLVLQEKPAHTKQYFSRELENQNINSGRKIRKS